jgi:4-aminobutyrate aminotransferase-like enzyme/Ser/Thr protein kinase RdoA (MazF antagonist)
LTNPFAGLEIPSPALSLERVADILATRYGKAGPLRSLGSHQDQNVMVDDPTGRFILKISNPGFSHEGLLAQNAAMLHLAAKDISFRAPVPVPDADDALIGTVTEDGVTFDVRLVTFLDGRPLSDFTYLAPVVLRRHGALAASAAIALADFDHPGLDRTLQWDLRHARDVVHAYAGAIPDEAARDDLMREMARAQRVIDVYEEELRIAPCHADVTDVNVVAQTRAGQPWPDGLIDFGDILRTWIAGDVAVAGVSLISHQMNDPLSVIADVLQGYHKVFPVTPSEVAALWPLVVARAASNVASSENQARLEPDDEYVVRSVEDDWRIWRAVRAVPWRAAHGLLADVVGLTPPVLVAPKPVAPLVEAIGNAPSPAHVMPSVDQSVVADTFEPARWNLADGVRTQLVNGFGVGRYAEGRLGETASDDGGVSTGVELFAPAGTPVTSPVAGDLTVDGDTAILAIDSSDEWRVIVSGLSDLTTAGHLGPGDLIGAVADRDNAHVRLQVVADPELRPPWLAARATGWLHATVDPVTWLATEPIPGRADPYASDAARLLERRDAVLAKAQEHYYQEPPQIERGWRHSMYDVDGRRYVDMVNNVTILGHSHPAVEAAVSRQLRLINTNSRFHYSAMVEFSERLTSVLPESLDTVFLVSTGSEAGEVALRLVRAATGSADMIAVRSAYHGWTTGTDAISTSISDNPQATSSRPPWVHVVDSPNPYRGQFRGPDAGARYAADVDRAIAAITERGDAPLGGFIAEPVYGNAGGVLLPDGYLDAVYRSVRAAGGVCVADEVQVGYGRLGDYFWGFEQQGVVPDIVTMAKCTANGVPVGAVVTSREIADRLLVEGSFFSSMGGSPMGCAAALATLDVIESERLQQNAVDIGRRIADGVMALAEQHPIIGTVHGLGLYRGIELVRDRETLEPAGDEAMAICERMRELGVIVQPTGDHMNVLKIKPPLCIDEAAADMFVDALAVTLRDGW